MDNVRPRFKPHVHVAVVEPDTAYPRREHRRSALRELLYRLLAPRRGACVA